MKLKTLFFGTPHFALSSFEATGRSSDLQAVVTQPDRPRGRGHQVSPCEIKEAAFKIGLKAFSPNSLKKNSPELADFENFLNSQNWDLFVVTAYGNLLPQKILDIPRLGCINVHASLLPKWRGAAPIQRSIEAGERVSGVALQKMVMALDAGDVLAEGSCDISDQDDAISLAQRLSELGGKLLGDYLDGLSALSPESQVLKGQTQDPSQVSFAAKITKEEGLWTPAWTAKQCFNRVRAFRSWPQVRAKAWDGTEFKILESALSSGKLSPGSIEIDGSTVRVGSFRSSETGECLELRQLQPANRGKMDAASFFRSLLEKSPPGQAGPQILKA